MTDRPSTPLQRCPELVHRARSRHSPKLEPSLIWTSSWHRSPTRQRLPDGNRWSIDHPSPPAAPRTAGAAMLQLMDRFPVCRGVPLTPSIRGLGHAVGRAAVRAGSIDTSSRRFRHVERPDAGRERIAARSRHAARGWASAARRCRGRSGPERLGNLRLAIGLHAPLGASPARCACTPVRRTRWHAAEPPRWPVEARCTRIRKFRRAVSGECARDRASTCRDGSSTCRATVDTTGAVPADGDNYDRSFPPPWHVACTTCLRRGRVRDALDLVSGNDCLRCSLRGK
jgi:hypothetical protein